MTAFHIFTWGPNGSAAALCGGDQGKCCEDDDPRINCDNCVKVEDDPTRQLVRDRIAEVQAIYQERRAVKNG